MSVKSFEQELVKQLKMSETPSSAADEQFSTRIPLTRLRPLIKLDPDVQITAQDAVFLIAKGKTELYAIP